MAKKVKKLSHDFFEEESFFDREEPRKEFWKKYDIVKQSSDAVQVLMYYGLGGMGKTSLLRQIEKEIDNKNEGIIREYYDLNDGQDSVVILRKIVKDLQQRYKFKFPVFSYAVYSYMLKCGEDAQTPEVKNILDDIPILREAFKLANVIPGVSAFSQPAEWIVDKICDSVDGVKKQKSKEIIEKINNASKEKLHNEIPFVFAQELNDNLEKRNNPVFVLILDTYERLVNELSTMGTPIENDLWLRDDNDGILLQINGLLCVLAGRESLKWKDMDPDWDGESLSQIEIDTLDRENSLLLLSKYGIDEKDIQNKILEVTQGMPLYLDVCVDTYRSAKSSGETVTQDLFDNKIEKLAKRLMTYMSDDEKDVLYLLSCLGRWKTEEYYAINDKLNRNSVNNSIYSKVLTLTFVRNEADCYFIHQTMQEILIQYCDEEKIENYAKAIYAYIGDENTLSPTAFKYLYLISKICGIRNNGKMTSWWIPKACKALNIYLDGFCLNQFISIYELLAPVADDYKLKTLYLNYLLKKGDYNKALEYINDTKAEDYNNIEVLNFLLTASYYYYINGIDDIAFKLRQKVYEKRMELLGDTDRETIRAGLALSASYSRMGKHEESINLGNECRARLEDSSDSYDSMISAARNQLGDSYFRLGNMEDAMKIYFEVYENRKKWLGEKNNSTMIAYNHIADCMVNLGKYVDALKIYKFVSEIRKQEFSRDEMYEYVVNGTTKKSNDHPDTIIADNNMAVCLIYMGKYEEAFNILSEVVAKREVTLKPDAPATMGALENLAMCEYYMGYMQNAVRHISTVISKLSEKLSADHYDVIIAKYHKAIIENDENSVDMIIDGYSNSLSFNSYYITYMKQRKFIGYFSLGRYYE